MIDSSEVDSTSPFTALDPVTDGYDWDQQGAFQNPSLKGTSNAVGIGLALRGFNDGDATFYVDANGDKQAFQVTGVIDAGCLQNGEGMFTYGDQYEAPSSAPSWFTALSDWEVEHFTATSAIVAPSPVPHPGSHSNWFENWSSGDYDSVRDQWVGWGGGHGGYAGNELYGWGPYLSENPTWYLITDHSPEALPPQPSNTDGAYSDGLPASVHVYDMAFFLPPNKFVQFGQAAPTPGTNYDDNIWTYDLSRTDADKYQRALAGWNKEHSSIGISSVRKDGIAIYNTLDGLVYYWSGHSSGGTAGAGTWNPSTGAFATLQTNVGSSQPLNSINQGVGAFSPDHGTNGCVAMITDDSGFQVADPTDGTMYGPSSTGASLSSSQGEHGLCYDKQRRVFLAWTGQSGNLIELQPPSNPFTGTWTFVNRSVTGSLPSGYDAQGMFGKMVYVDSLHAVSIMATYSSGVHIVKLP
jgi:hypothetical protein